MKCGYSWFTFLRFMFTVLPERMWLEYVERVWFHICYSKILNQWKCEKEQIKSYVMLVLECGHILCEHFIIILFCKMWHSLRNRTMTQLYNTPDAWASIFAIYLESFIGWQCAFTFAMFSTVAKFFWETQVQCVFRYFVYIFFAIVFAWLLKFQTTQIHKLFFSPFHNSLLLNIQSISFVLLHDLCTDYSQIVAYNHRFKLFNCLFLFTTFYFASTVNLSIHTISTARMNIENNSIIIARWFEWNFVLIL